MMEYEPAYANISIQTIHMKDVNNLQTNATFQT